VPTYEYLCPVCGRKFEVFQGIKAKPYAKCLACGGFSRKRLVGKGGGIIFKGNGWPGQEIAREGLKKETV